MSDFKFDKDKTKTENLEAFLQHIETEDTELGSLFREHFGKLQGANDEAKRKAARNAFNSAVNVALKAKLLSDENSK